MSEHYFSAESATPDARRPLVVRLAGAERHLRTSSGVFSGTGLDKATAVLLDHRGRLAPIGPHARVVDLGCGWGPIALTIALEHPDAEVLAVDVSARARALTAENAALLGCANVRVLAPQEVPADLQADVLWSNPPIRIGKGALHALLEEWISRLAPSGTAAMVVGRNLGADSLMAWLTAAHPEREVVRAASSKGFRVLELLPRA